MNGEDIATQFDAPDWLNELFVQKALQRGGERNVKVEEIAIKAATAPGQNFASTMFRVKITPEYGENGTVIVKTLPPGDTGQMVQDHGLFQSERIMFGDVIPKMEALLHSASSGRYPPLTARGLHLGTDPSEFLVLEDLTSLGFQMADKYKGLGLRHCLVALRALGRFHAASVALLQTSPSVGEGLRNPFKGNPGVETIVSTGMDCTENACLSWPGFEEYGRALNTIKPFLMEKIADLNEPKAGAFNVILHGDFWTNNIMFHYNNGVPMNVRLVDLQFSHVASPALDLLYFLGTSPSEDVSAHHQDLLIREYHKALSEAMELLQLKPPSLEELLEDIDSHGSYALLATFCSFPIIMSPTELDLGAIALGNAGAFSLYQDLAIKRRLQRLIPEYTRKGWMSR